MGEWQDGISHGAEMYRDNDRRFWMSCEKLGLSGWDSGAYVHFMHRVVLETWDLARDMAKSYPAVSPDDVADALKRAMRVRRIVPKKPLA